MVLSNATTYVSLFLFCTLLIGFYEVFKVNRAIKKQKDFAEEYQKKFSLFIEKIYQGREHDSEIYVWLTKNVTKIHNEMGEYGVIALYRRPFSPHTHQNFQIIPNLLPEFAKGNAEIEEAQICYECLLRYQGYIEEMIKPSKANLRNPLKWFQEGIQTILLIPLLLLSSFGVLGSSFVRSIKNSTIFQVLAGLVAFVGFLSSLSTIVVGWGPTIDFLAKITEFKK